MARNKKGTDEFSLENHYTLAVTRRTGQKWGDSGYNSHTVRSERTITRTFNFLSCQVTTTTQAVAFARDVAPSIATTQHIQNFSDIESPREIAFMHQELLKLGGQPPALDEVLNVMDKKGLKGATPVLQAANR